jgi:hypothetical protein
MTHAQVDAHRRRGHVDEMTPAQIDSQRRRHQTDEMTPAQVEAHRRRGHVDEMTPAQVDAQRRRAQSRRRRGMLNIARDPDGSADAHSAGAMNVACANCKALHWRNEKSTSTPNGPVFSICCNSGKVLLNELLDVPSPLKELLSRQDAPSKAFVYNIRNYNNVMAMTSMGGNFSAKNHGGIFTFKVQGELYHQIGSLLPQEGQAKMRTPDDYNNVVCAEIPNKQLHPAAYETVRKCMIHGPCGADNPKSPCMTVVNGVRRCSKRFPKPFTEFTTADDDGYPRYQRRDDGRKIQITRAGSKKYEVDNRYVVPYNRYLLERLNAHINVEVCSTVSAVKYLYKYVYKGPDRAVLQMRADGDIDEISLYLDARWVSSCEAIGRIYGFKIHNEPPAVLGIFQIFISITINCYCLLFECSTLVTNCYLLSRSFAISAAGVF